MNFNNPNALMNYVCKQNGRPDLAAIPPECPLFLRDLMTKCWAPNPTMRPTFQDILDDFDRNMKL